MSDTEADLRPEVEIELKFPVELDGQTIKKITMRRPKVKDQKAVKHIKDPGDMGLKLMSILCDQPPEFFDEMDSYDLNALQEQFARFLGQKSDS